MRIARSGATTLAPITRTLASLWARAISAVNTQWHSDPEFTARYVDQDPLRYQTVVAGMSRLLFDRDTVPGAEPEDLLALNIRTLIVPGDDTSHAPSAAHYLRECLPAAEFWDVPVAAQTAETAPARVIEFLESLPL